MIHTIGRIKSKEYTQEELDNRYKYDWCKEKGLVCNREDPHYFLRYCDDMYLGRKEHLILLKKTVYGNTRLREICKHLSR